MVFPMWNFLLIKQWNKELYIIKEIAFIQWRPEIYYCIHPNNILVSSEENLKFRCLRFNQIPKVKKKLSSFIDGFFHIYFGRFFFNMTACIWFLKGSCRLLNNHTLYMYRWHYRYNLFFKNTKNKFRDYLFFKNFSIINSLKLFLSYFLR